MKKLIATITMLGLLQGITYIYGQDGKTTTVYNWWPGHATTWSSDGSSSTVTQPIPGGPVYQYGTDTTPVIPAQPNTNRGYR